MKKTLVSLLLVVACIFTTFSFTACENKPNDDADANLEQLKQQTIESIDKTIEHSQERYDRYLARYAKNYLERAKSEIQNTKSEEELNTYYNDEVRLWYSSLFNHYKFDFGINEWSTVCTITTTGEYGDENYVITHTVMPSPLSSYIYHPIKLTSSGNDMTMDLKVVGTGIYLSGNPDKAPILSGVTETNVIYRGERVNPYVEIVVKKGEAVVGYTLINICGDNNLIEESQTLIKKDSNSITADQAFGIMDDIIAGKASQTEVKTKGNNTSYSMEHEYEYPGLVGLQIDVVRNGNSTAQSQLKFTNKGKPTHGESVCDFTFCAVGTTTSHMQGSVQYEKEHKFKLGDSICVDYNNENDGYIKVFIEQYGFVSGMVILAVNHDKNGLARFDFVHALNFWYKNRYYFNEKEFTLPDEFMASSFADYFIDEYEKAIAPKTYEE